MSTGIQLWSLMFPPHRMIPILILAIRPYPHTSWHTIRWPNMSVDQPYAG